MAGSSECLAHGHDYGNHSTELVLNNFPILAEKCVGKTEGADGPGIMVTPDDIIDSNYTEDGR